MPHHTQEMSGGLETVGDATGFPMFLNSQGQRVNTHCIFKKHKMKVANNLQGVEGRAGVGGLVKRESN